MFKIKNLPLAFYRPGCWVVTNWVDGDYWYYGTWEDRDEANEIALTLSCGAVFSADMVEFGGY
jgi:hypothetical protein